MNNVFDLDYSMVRNHIKKNIAMKAASMFVSNTNDFDPNDKFDSSILTKFSKLLINYIKVSSATGFWS